MGMKRIILFFVILSVVVCCSSCARTFNTANINLHNIELTEAIAHSAAAYYLSEDGTLYCPGTDSDAASFVVYQDQENGIVAENVKCFREMIGGGCYIDKNNNLYMWCRNTIPLYGYHQAKTHKCIVNNVKTVVPYAQYLLFIDLNDNLYLLGEFEGERYSVDNPKRLAADISCVSIAITSQTTILWSSLNGDIGGIGIEDDGLLAELNSHFANSTVSDIQIASDFVVVLSDDQVWFYGDYKGLISGNNAQTTQWVQLDQNITKISCSRQTIAALDVQGNMKIWGRCISNDAKNTYLPEYEYCENKVITSKARNIFISDFCICYIDTNGRSQIFHSDGWQSFYGNATTDTCVGIYRAPNTWIE